jgi:two-component system nitrate/nitrite response regulator NarL
MRESAMTGALICDEHLLFAEALASALNRRGIETTAVSRFAEAFEIVNTEPPAYVVLAEDRASASCEDNIRRIRELCADSRLVCVTADGHGGHGSSYAAAGADLVLSKERPLGVLVDGVLAGSAPARPRSATSPGTGGPGVPRRPKSGPLAAHFLTNRERDVLRLLVGGASTTQISASLGIASVTARSYVQDTMTKLGVHTRLEAVRYAMLYSVV